MSLLEMQRALSRLLTDEELRDLFFADADAAFRSYDLSPGERASLRDVDKKRIAIHSHLVMHARVKRVLAALPLTSRVVEHHADEIAPEYCKCHPPAPASADALQQEIAQLAGFLRRHQAATGRWPGYLGDLLRYEECLFRLGCSLAAWASCEHASRTNAAASVTLTLATAESFIPVLGAHAELQSFGHDMAALALELELGRVPDEAPVEPTRMLLFRERGSGTVRSGLLNELPFRLLEHCDGQRSVAQVIGWIACELGVGDDERAALSHGACDLFRTLWEAGALAFVARRSGELVT